MGADRLAAVMRDARTHPLQPTTRLCGACVLKKKGSPTHAHVTAHADIVHLWQGGAGNNNGIGGAADEVTLF
jgi:hypothetical protein